MKKLLIASDNFLPRWDGISRFLADIIPELQNDFEITVLAPRFKGEFRGFDKTNIVRFKTLNFQVGDITPAWPNKKQVVSAVSEADIIWSQTLGPVGAITILEAKKQNKPVFSFIHSIEWELFSKSVKSFRDIVYMFSKVYARWLYNKCTVLMVPSLEVEELFSYNGIRTEKKVVHMGINIEKFKPAEDKVEAKKKVGINPENKIIGYTGRIAREKDIMTLYRAFKKLKNERKDIQLLVVGDGLKHYKKVLSEDKDVILTGPVNNVHDYLQAMDIYVLTSLTETSSLSTMEAMACGIPVITTKVGFVKRYVHEKENGMFFPKKNDTVLSIKINMLLNDKELMESLSKNARKTIVERYQWKSTVERVKSILSSPDASQ